MNSLWTSDCLITDAPIIVWCEGNDSDGEYRWQQQSTPARNASRTPRCARVDSGPSKWNDCFGPGGRPGSALTGGVCSARPRGIEPAVAQHHVRGDARGVLRVRLEQAARSAIPLSAYDTRTNSFSLQQVAFMVDLAPEYGAHRGCVGDRQQAGAVVIAMLDVIFAAATVLFFLLAAAYVGGLQRVG